MLKMIVDRHILYVLMGVFCVAGAAGKSVTNVSLNHLVRGAGNMNKSTHPLMRLVRAKFEHACMVSEKVENVGAFVDKYLYEYRVLRVRLHSWRRLELTSAGICFLLGLLGALSEYVTYGMQDEVLKIGGTGAILGILLYLLHLSTDEKYRLEAARNYMVDYLENVCLHRYEKAYQKELKVMATEAVGGVECEKTESIEEKEMPPLPTTPEIEPPAEPEPAPVPDEKEPIRSRDVLIRQILEEFMA